ncbi:MULTISPECIES: amino acid ABC transporter substrate-binding protein [unclassified Gilliamella]|uniref:amino acid ABC transporter substrate-binding protein n=1 Tax=unclassified Gilliamella TaxID=2685620 RepID=UPI0013073B43|nr:MULTISPECIES: amino acid ABC transporter substrate-binding protein [unclassified Gilliamella]MWP49678.1 transporter substrate-binding domain-containing protein [Gilliamella sp. Lep-s35]MWP69486.1 transporter substrate-binding domain-containing protein [Gilliamella sp. Lep-s5]MWP77750.1 transporter substrate-binding domain-containing protein [Gilliamella sp. Lep-s21]
MKKIRTLLSVLLLTSLTLIGCDNQSNSKTTEQPTIKVGSTGQSYPNGYKQNGNLVGFDVEITEAIAKELGYKVEWVIAEFGGLMGQFDSGRLDTIANAVAVTPFRQAKYDFSNTYSFYGSQIVTHKDNNINTLSDFKGKTIAGVLGSNHINNLKKAFPNNDITIKTYETQDGAMYDTEYQRVDGYINSKPILLAEIKRKNLPFKLIGEPITIEQVAFPFSKDEKGRALREKFNQALEKLKANGTLKNLSIKYFGEDITS